MISVWQRLDLAAHRRTPAGRLGPVRVPFIVASDRRALLRSRRLRGVELPVALFDAASPLVAGKCSELRPREMGTSSFAGGCGVAG